ncbi:PREDICTED: nucleolar complex protein 3 homolog isoform X1 [Populus euphratica]|uniref:Nucleolar complex protein 3 homolog isoform X1 n=1 Tax=Populus euphratica TaxID=75702 RepID=A0AAJ6U3G8_POPEU|nr:PREDICTED: nucleolar complex protein 3 homolog isoform X1 [Populus euphratica]
MGKKNKQKQKIILPPELPPEVPDDEIEVSDEDLQFVNENLDYAGFVSGLDTTSITKHVTRVADLKEDALERLYERRLQKKKLKEKEEEEKESRVEVDRVDALPVKSLDGQVYYRTLAEKKGGDGGEEEDGGGNKGIVRLTKTERRAKLKKSKKEAKKLGKQVENTEQVEATPQAAVLAEVKEDITAEATFETKKRKLAELGIALLADPESNIKSLKEMLQFCHDDDDAIIKLGLLSLLAVFKDIIPGYRIRLPTEKELEMKVSKEVKKMRFYESTLLSVYKSYLQKLVLLEKKSKFQHVAVRCICTLLEAVPHFNFRESLLAAVVKNIGSQDDVIRKLSCSAIKSIFVNEGKHGGAATVEAVELIADHVKAHNCQLHPDAVEVFISLSFHEDLRKPEEPDKESKVKYKKNRKRKNVEEPSQLQESDRKRSKKELMAKMREEVTADYKSAVFTPDVKEQRKMQSDMLSAVFETYFRILKHVMQSTAASSQANGTLVAGESGAHPLLAPCLNGLGKFTHFIDLDYIGDLMNYLKKLAAGGSSSDNSSEKCAKGLTVSERLQCCIVAFKVMRSNLDALNVDLQGFFVQLYNLILEYRPGRDQGEVLVEALKIMLFEDRQHDMQKAAAFVKRLATFSLCFGSAESMAALVTLKQLLQKNVKCRNLLENDAGGGSVSGSIAKYQPYATDPNLSGALASVLWELNLLCKHYQPAISTIASSISTMSTSHNQVYLASTSPQQAFRELSLEQESFNPKTDLRKSNNKRKRGSGPSRLASIEESVNSTGSLDEDELRKKLYDHFSLLRDFKESEKLRTELDRTTSALQLYEEYKQQKKKKNPLDEVSRLEGREFDILMEVPSTAWQLTSFLFHLRKRRNHIILFPFPAFTPLSITFKI